MKILTHFLKALLQSIFCLVHVIVSYYVFIPEHQYRYRTSQLSQSVLWIRICMDPELLPGSGSGIKVPDPDPAKSKRAYK